MRRMSLSKTIGNILSLDVSASCTGWSVITGKGTVLKYGTIITSPKLKTPARLDQFRKELKLLLVRHKPAVVLLEDTFSGKFPAVVKLLAKFGGVAEQVIYEHCKACPCIINNKSVKAYFKTKNKEALFETVADLLGWDPATFSYKKYNDVVDSIAQLMYYSDEVINRKKYRLECDYGYKFLYQQ